MTIFGIMYQCKISRATSALGKNQRTHALLKWVKND